MQQLAAGVCTVWRNLKSYRMQVTRARACWDGVRQLACALRDAGRARAAGHALAMATRPVWQWHAARVVQVADRADDGRSSG